MYLIIIKSSFNYYTHTVVLVAHDGSQIAETRSPFSCSQHYRCCCLYFYRLYYYYFFCALALFPFLFYSSRVVVLAATTTGFSFLFFSFSFFLFFFCRCKRCFLSANTLLCWLAITRRNMMMNEHFASSYGKERKRERQEGYHGVLFPT